MRFEMKWFSKIRECFPRQEERFPTFAAVEFMTEQGQLIAKATLRDISSSGGFLRISGATVLPEEFVIRIPKLGRNIAASLKWRLLDQIGVRFDQKVDLEVFKSRQEDRAMTVAGYFRPNTRIAA
jgi:hypothetical protein